jgi:hypothetical protein
MNNTQQRYAHRKYYDPITKELVNEYPDNLTAYHYYHRNSKHYHHKKLHPKQVREIRRYHAKGYRIKDLAQLYKVSTKTISGIVHFRLWAWVK